MSDIGLSVYHTRALQLADAMQLCRDDMDAYGSAAALLAIHSAISYNDAVVLTLLGRRPNTEDHQRAITATEKACAMARVNEKQGVKHLRKLLGAKNDVAYGDRQLEPATIEGLCIAAERFQTWAERLLIDK